MGDKITPEEIVKDLNVIIFAKTDQSLAKGPLTVGLKMTNFSSQNDLKVKCNLCQNPYFLQTVAQEKVVVKNGGITFFEFKLKKNGMPHIKDLPTKFRFEFNVSNEIIGIRQISKFFRDIGNFMNIGDVQNEKEWMQLASNAEISERIETINEYTYRYNVDFKTQMSIFAPSILSDCFSNLQGFSNLNELNIYIVGPAGIGKSSYIQALYGLFYMDKNNEVTHGDVAVDGSTEHVTTQLKKYDFRDRAANAILKNSDVPILDIVKLYDMLGMTPENFSNELLEHLARGHIIKETELENWNSNKYFNDIHLKKHVETTKLQIQSRMPHVILYFVPLVDIINDDKTREMVIAKKKVLDDLKIQFIIVITFVDRHEPFSGMKEHPLNPPEEFKTFKTNISKLLNCPENRITYTVGCQEQVHRNFEIDQLILDNLCMAIKQSYNTANTCTEYRLENIQEMPKPDSREVQEVVTAVELLDLQLATAHKSDDGFVDCHS